MLCGGLRERCRSVCISPKGRAKLGTRAPTQGALLPLRPGVPGLLPVPSSGLEKRGALRPGLRGLAAGLRLDSSGVRTARCRADALRPGVVRQRA